MSHPIFVREKRREEKEIKLLCPGQISLSDTIYMYSSFKLKYRIQPNYRTVHLCFSELLGTLSCVKICINLLTLHYKKKSEKDLFDDDYAIFFPDFLHKGICCGYSFELHQQVDAIQMSTHNICLYKEVR